MEFKLISTILSFLLINGIYCSKKRGTLYGIGVGETKFPNGIKSNLEYMNEDDHYGRFFFSNYQPFSRYEIPFRYPIIPIPYSYIPSNFNRREYYVERIPSSFTYEVTEHINKMSSTTSKPLVGYRGTSIKPVCDSKKLPHEVTTSVTNEVNSSTSYKKDTKVDVVKSTEESSTLGSGPDVMLSDSVRTSHTSIWKREVKTAVPLEILFDDAPINATHNDTNISQYLNKIFGDLDQQSLTELITSLKDEYLTTATSGESKIIEETFKKLATSLSGKNKRSNADSMLVADEKTRTELLAKAAAALGLLAEESTTMKDDSLEDFLEDESYHEIYEDVSHEISDDVNEPTFLELLTIATKHKASKALKNDQTNF